MHDVTLLVDGGELAYLKYWITLLLSPVSEYRAKAAWLNMDQVQVGTFMSPVRCMHDSALVPCMTYACWMPCMHADTQFGACKVLPGMRTLARLPWTHLDCRQLAWAGPTVSMLQHVVD
jgi:hypothetical protein